MADEDLLREIRRLESEVASVCSQIREAVYRAAWDSGRLQSLDRQLSEAKDRLERLRTGLSQRLEPPPGATWT